MHLVQQIEAAVPLRTFPTLTPPYSLPHPILSHLIITFRSGIHRVPSRHTTSLLLKFNTGWTRLVGIFTELTCKQYNCWWARNEPETLHRKKFEHRAALH